LSSLGIECGGDLERIGVHFGDGIERRVHLLDPSQVRLDIAVSDVVLCTGWHRIVVSRSYRGNVGAGEDAIFKCGYDVVDCRIYQLGKGLAID
jgi:hypothetical protein